MEYTPIATETINGQPIHVYGSFDEPLFISGDLGTVVGTTSPSVVIKNFNKTEKLKGNVRIDGRVMPANLLTRAGTRKFFMKVGQEIPHTINKYIDPNAQPLVQEVLHEALAPVRDDVVIAAPEALGTAFIADLLKDVFNGKEVRILGTIDKPLFVAKDIGDILGIQNVRESIKDYGELERVVKQIYTPGGLQKAILLTERGLYRLLNSSNKPEAQPFQTWVGGVVEEVRLKGNYDIRTDMNKRELQHAAVDDHPALPANERLPEEYRPVITYHPCDINDYIDEPCIYLLHLKDLDFKYGKSGEINVRIVTHTQEFKKHGCAVRIVKLWRCSTMKIMNKIEKMIKTYAQQTETAAEKYGQTEILTTNNIDFVALTIDKYVERENRRCEKVADPERLKLETAKIQAEAERERIALERERVALESYRLRIQLEPPRSIPGSMQLTYPVPCAITYRPPIHDDNKLLPDEPPAVDIPMARPPAVIAAPVPMIAPVQPAPIAIPAPLKQQKRVKTGKALCECGKMVSPTNRAHLAGTRHTAFMAQKNER